MCHSTVVRGHSLLSRGGNGGEDFEGDYAILTGERRGESVIAKRVLRGEGRWDNYNITEPYESIR